MQHIQKKNKKQKDTNNYLYSINTAEESSAGKHIENEWMVLSEYKTPIPQRS